MSTDIPRPHRSIRRPMARRALVGAALVAAALTAACSTTPPPAAPVAPTAAAAPSAAAPAGTPQYQVPGVPTVVDTSHATPETARFFGTYFEAKSEPNVARMMDHFHAGGPFRYIDAPLGVSLDYQGLNDLFATFMPNWRPEANSYPTRVVGDTTSAVVSFNNVAGLFGPNELRITAIVDFEDGKVVRQVDYWDSRHYGRAETQQLRDGLGVTQYPTDFHESIPGEQAAPVIQQVASQLNAALAAGDAAAATALFAPDAVYEDNTTHLHLNGTAAIGRYLSRTGGALPYASEGVAVRHVAGSAQGGGYEWTTTGAVPNGLNVLELDDSGKITRLTAVWDGAYVSDEQLDSLMRASIES